MPHIIAQANRTGTAQGIYDVPAGLTGIVRITGVIADADRSDPANSLQCILEKSNDGGITWLSQAWFSWQGGIGVGNPSVELDLISFAGKRARVTITVAQRMNWGADIDLL